MPDSELEDEFCLDSVNYRSVIIEFVDSIFYLYYPRGTVAFSVKSLVRIDELLLFSDDASCIGSLVLINDYDCIEDRSKSLNDVFWAFYEIEPTEIFKLLIDSALLLAFACNSIYFYNSSFSSSAASRSICC